MGLAIASPPESACSSGDGTISFSSPAHTASCRVNPQRRLHKPTTTYRSSALCLDSAHATPTFMSAEILPEAATKCSAFLRLLEYALPKSEEHVYVIGNSSYYLYILISKSTQVRL